MSGIDRHKYKDHYYVVRHPENSSEEVSTTSVREIHRVTSRIAEMPYFETRVLLQVVFKEYNPDYGDNKLCKCGHPYYRHFDSYEGMAPVGCKYCQCDEFIPAEEPDNG